MTTANVTKYSCSIFDITSEIFETAFFRVLMYILLDKSRGAKVNILYHFKYLIVNLFQDLCICNNIPTVTCINIINSNHFNLCET